VRLSQRERRLLAELEQALTREDPRFVQQFAAPPAAPTSPPARGGTASCLSSDCDRDTSAVDELDRVHVLRPRRGTISEIAGGGLLRGMSHDLPPGGVCAAEDGARHRAAAAISPQRRCSSLAVGAVSLPGELLSDGPWQFACGGTAEPTQRQAGRPIRRRDHAFWSCWCGGECRTVPRPAPRQRRAVACDAT
jgi:hypothetical protein